MVEQRVVSVAQAKSGLSALIAAVEAGETVVITKRGRPVAEMRGRRAPATPVDLAQLQRTTKGMKVADEAVDVVRRLRDDAQY